MEIGNLGSFVHERSHFGLWTIVSSPLILGHNLLDNATNDRIWPIVTNKAAIEVSQRFATGKRAHPGGRVRSWTPAAPPGPPAPSPSPPPAPPGSPCLSNASSCNLMAQADSSSATAWKVPTVGSAGALTHLASGLCVIGGEQQQQQAPTPCKQVCVCVCVCVRAYQVSHGVHFSESVRFLSDDCGISQ